MKANCHQEVMDTGVLGRKGFATATLLALWISSFAAVGAVLGQGVISTSTKVPGMVDAQVTDGDTGLPIEGPRWMGQFYVSQAPLGALAAVGSPLPLGSGEEAGYMPSATAIVPFVAPGELAEVQLRVWSMPNGWIDWPTCFESVGESKVITIILGNEGQPALLEGLEPFTTVTLANNVELRGYATGDGKVALSWSIECAWTVAVLQEADHPDGPWRDIPSDNSWSAKVEPGGLCRFYRLRRSE